MVSATFLEGVEDARSRGKLDPLLRTDVMLAAHAYAELNAQRELEEIGQSLSDSTSLRTSPLAKGEPHMKMVLLHDVMEKYGQVLAPKAGKS